MLLMREYRIGDEPIPNYRLVRFLGRGGFGEVWQAKAPGGIEVAMKFIRLDKKAGKKEFESLRVVKRIKHPYLMAINAFWLKDAEGNVLDDDSIDLLGMNLLAQRGGRKAASETAFFAESQAAELVIALELCDKNLLDRLRECQAAGLQGIPPDELLDYMEGCAKAIDYLNSPVHLLEDGEKKAVQHCDIKPQNIMLLSGLPKVCDFGLVRAQSDVRKTAIAASLAYAPPEILIQGQQSEATDQYSLAVSYYELRTGELPFSDEAANHFAIMKAHEQGTLDFSRLPDGERAVIERATMLNPAARFARTADMVAALRRAHRGESDILPVSGPADRLQAGQELVPGYLLKDYLFRADGRTEVWDATRANGDEHALWIYDLTSYRGEIDLEALRRLRARSHPQLASLFDFWLLDGERRVMDTGRATGGAPPRMLVIASERTRDNLVFLVDECRRRSGDGLPAERLLGCLKQVAVALDALNGGDAGAGPIAHCDVRPANLLLFGETTKLGNFAWCRALGEGNVELSEPSRRSEWRTTAPEVVHGRPSPRSDQYSLADSYVQMRTGQLLGDSLSSSSQSSGRLSGRLDLTVLRPDEQQVVRRALSEVPAERYSSCTEFVEQLALVVQPVPVRTAADDGRVQTLEPGDLSSPAKSWKDTRPIKKTPTAPISMPEPAHRGGLRRVAFVTLLLGGMAVGAVLLARLYVEQSVDRALVDREMEVALAVLKRFERMPFLIAPDLPGRVVRRADERVADDWHRSLKVYDGLVSGWPGESGLPDLKDKLIQSGVEEFDGLIDKDPEAAEELRCSLAASFGDDDRIRKLPKIEPWETKVRSSLASARKKLSDRLTASAADDCAAAEALLEAHAGGQPDLQRDLSLLRIAVSIQKLEWEEAEQRLARAAADESFDRAPPHFRARRAALQAIVGTHYTGGKLDPSRPDEALKTAATELAPLEDIAPDWWGGSNDEFEARLAKMLVDELVLRAVDFVFSQYEGRRGVGEALLTELSSLRTVSDQLPVRMAKSLLLLRRPAPAATPDEIGTSLESWLESKKLPTESREFAGRVAVLAGAVTQWGLHQEHITVAEKHLQQISAASGVSVSNELLRLGEYALRALVNESPPAWRKIKAKCGELGYLANTSKQEPAAFVAFGRAECIIELSTEDDRAADAAQALEIIASVAKSRQRRESDADRPYFDYVDLLARDAAGGLGPEDEWLPLADSLGIGLKRSAPGPLSVPDRASRGRELLGRLATKLLGLDADGVLDSLKPLNIDIAQAERVYGWFASAGGVATEPDAGEVKLALAIAALAKQPRDEVTAGPALEQLISSGRKDLQLLLLRANLSATSDVDAISCLSQTWDQLRSVKGKQDWLAIYQHVVEPAIQRIQRLPEVRRSTIAEIEARFHAAKGKLIRRSIKVENLVFDESGKLGADAIYAAYDDAIKHDPAPAEYYIERGTARYEMPGCDVDVLVNQDLNPARDRMGDSLPEFHGLVGAAKALEARREVSRLHRTDSIRLFKDAIEAYQRALTECDETSEFYPRYLVFHSMANLELANHTTEPTSEIRKYLQAAKASGELAKDQPFASHPEYAWRALGNAEEDFGLLLREFEHYRTALDVFQEAKSAAEKNSVPLGPSQIALARVRFRIAREDPGAASQRAELIRAALADLSPALESTSLSRTEKAEGYYWRANLCSLNAELTQTRVEEAAKNARLARDKADRATAEKWQAREGLERKQLQRDFQAADEAQGQAARLVDRGSADWAEYQLHWAKIALTAKDKISRARELLESGAIDAAKRAEAVGIIAVSQAPTAGLAEFRKYLPLANLAAATPEDAQALIYVAQYIRGAGHDFWLKNADLCERCTERALELGAAAGRADIIIFANAELAYHYNSVAVERVADPKALLEAVIKVQASYQKAFAAGDALADASLTARERQQFENYVLRLRRDFAEFVCGSASNRNIPRPEARALCEAALDAIRKAKDKAALEDDFDRFSKRLRQIIGEH